MEEFEEFANEELDPVEEIKLRELYDKEMEDSMRTAFRFIEEIGIDSFIQEGTEVSPERKLRILRNMVDWFAHPDREEYEKAAILQSGVNKLQKNVNNF